MGFTEDMAAVDDDVDTYLGDDILYKAAGTSTYASINGFIAIAEEALGIGEIDPARLTKRVKVQRLVVPSPLAADRWQCEALFGPGTWSMTNAEPQVAGRYWVIELQRARTNI